MDQSTNFAFANGTPTALPKRKDPFGDEEQIYVLRTLDETVHLAGACPGCSTFWCGLDGGCAARTNWGKLHALIKARRFREAYEALEESNPFAGLMGTCNADCQVNCSVNHNFPHGIAIQSNEASLCHWARDENLIKPRIIPPRNGRRVLIIGGGIAGMGAAHALVVRGYEVTVLERTNAWFGLVNTAVPYFKWDKSWIDLYVRNLEAEGVILRPNVNAGADFSFEEMEGFDAVIVAIGATNPNVPSGVPGHDLEGVHSALDFLTLHNRAKRSATPNPIDVTQAEIAVVVGGRETADDTVKTVRRLNPNARIVQIIRAKRPEGACEKPIWPQREDPYLAVADDPVSEKLWETEVTMLAGNGRVNEVHLMQGGHPIEPLRSTKLVVFYAIGFRGPEQGSLLGQLMARGAKLDRRGTLVTDQNLRIGIPKFYAGGDSTTGMSDFVKAYAGGRDAAACVDFDLQGETTIRSRRHHALV